MATRRVRVHRPAIIGSPARFTTASHRDKIHERGERLIARMHVDVGAEHAARARCGSGPDDHFVAGALQERNERAADEPGRTRDEDTHAFSLKAGRRDALTGSK
jgi:hypothetical protein